MDFVAFHDMCEMHDMSLPRLDSYDARQLLPSDINDPQIAGQTIKPFQSIRLHSNGYSISSQLNS